MRSGLFLCVAGGFGVAHIGGNPRRFALANVTIRTATAKKEKAAVALYT
jgi:hypothetical protein